MKVNESTVLIGTTLLVVALALVMAWRASAIPGYIKPSDSPSVMMAMSSACELTPAFRKIVPS